jgi:hypothetical protein
VRVKEEAEGEREKERESMHDVEYQIDVFVWQFCQVEAQRTSGADDGRCEAASRI